MRKLLFLVLGGIFMLSNPVKAEDKIETEIALPTPDYESGRPLMQTLKELGIWMYMF